MEKTIWSLNGKKSVEWLYLVFFLLKFLIPHKPSTNHSEKLVIKGSEKLLQYSEGFRIDFGMVASFRGPEAVDFGRGSVGFGGRIGSAGVQQARRSYSCGVVWVNVHGILSGTMESCSRRLVWGKVHNDAGESFGFVECEMARRDELGKTKKFLQYNNNI